MLHGLDAVVCILRDRDGPKKSLATEFNEKPVDACCGIDASDFSDSS